MDFSVHGKHPLNETYRYQCESLKQKKKGCERNKNLNHSKRNPYFVVGES